MTTTPDYLYACHVVRVVDADTLIVDVDLGFRAWLRDTPVRLFGLDAPEARTVEGKAATLFAAAWLPPAWDIVIRSAKPGLYGDKYGRWLATVYDGERCLNADLISARMARPWDGTGPKPTAWLT